MADFRILCREAGLCHVSTSLASGNVVFPSGLSETDVKAAFEPPLSRPREDRANRLPEMPRPAASSWQKYSNPPARHRPRRPRIITPVNKK